MRGSIRGQIDRILITPVIFILLFTGAVSSSFAIELKTAAQDSTPKYFLDEDDRMGGICVDIMQAIEVVDPEIKFAGYQRILPFKRLQMYLEEGRIDVFFGFRETAQRKEKYIFLNIPLYQIRYVAAVRIEDNVNINALNDVRALGSDGVILTVHGSAASRFLTGEGGLLVDDGAVNPTTLLKMLMGGRGRFAFYHDLGLRSAIRMETLEKKVRILPASFLTYSHYAAFSKNTDTTTIAKVKRAIEKLIHNGTLAEIHHKYDLRDY